IKASAKNFEVPEDDEEEVPVKTKKASKYKSRRNQGQEVDEDETEEVRCRTTKASKFKCKTKRVSDKEEDDDEEECGWKPKKASSGRERRGYEAEEEEEEEEEEQGVGAGGRRLSVSPAVYRDNSLSKGGLAKDKGCVVRGRPFKKQPNVNCRIESFGYTLMELSDTKRKWVEEIGFDGLFSLIGKGLTRNLCYWLMTRVDVPNRIFISVDGKEFPLTKVQVHWVMGLPIGPNLLPKGDDNGRLKEDLGRLWSKYSSKAPSGAAGISRKNVVDVLLSDDVLEKDFKECFVMLALMDVLCPTTCHRMSSKLLPYVCYAVRARQYDWCSLVLEHLFHSIQNFAKRFYPDGYAKGCGGCTIFLAVLYLDKLKRQPTQWGVFPRLKAWSKKEMNKARACDELPTGDYGKLGVVDVAYGENHPLDCRDSMPGVRSGNFQSHMMTVEDLLNLIRSMGNVNNEAGSSSSQCHENPCDASRAKKGGNRRRKDVKNPWQHKQEKESRQRESLTPLAREEENHYSEQQDNDMVIEHDIVDSVVKNVCDSVTNDRDVGSYGGKGMFFEEDGIRYEWGTTGMVCSSVDGGVGDIRDADASQNEETVGLGGGQAGDFGVGEDAGDVGGGEDNVGVDGGVEMNLDDDGVVVDDSAYRLGAIVPVGATLGAKNSKGGVDLNRVLNDDEAPEVEYIGQRSRVQRKSRARTRSKSEYKHPLLKNYSRFRTALWWLVSSEPIDVISTQLLFGAVEKMQHSVLFQQLYLLLVCFIFRYAMVYVRVVAMMYGRVWAKRYEGRSRRIMLDPAFAVGSVIHLFLSMQLVISGSHDHESVSASDVIQRTVARIQDKDRIPTYSLNMVFVPVYEGGRWWCLIFSFNRAEIVVVDAALSKRASEVHHLSVGKLIHAMDLVLQQADQTWQTGLLWGWTVTSMDIYGFNEWYETGVVMLEVVKECSDRLLQSYDVGGFAEQRLRLLCDDITCEFNEVKHETEAFLNSWRIRRSRN
ncbi:Homeobox protein Hox-A2, partial [Bienertia sinuspersici]